MATAPAQLDFMASTYELTQEVQTATLTNANWSDGLSGIDVKLPKQGFYSDMLLYFEATGGSSTSSVAFNADAPYNLVTNLLTSIQNENLSNSQVDNMSGYGLMLQNLLTYNGSQNLTNLTTTDTTNGNFSFWLAVPRILSYFSGVGCVGLNGSGGEPSIKLTLAGSGAVYSTPPTTMPTLTVKGYYRFLPAPTSGNISSDIPPFYGTILQRTSESHTYSGTGTVELTTRGGLIKSYILVFRDSSGNRVANDLLPDPIQLSRDITPMARIHTVEHLALQQYYLQNASLPTGVVFVPFDIQKNGKIGKETNGQQWRKTYAQDTIYYQGATTSTFNLEVHTEMVSLPSLPSGVSMQDFFDLL